MVRPAEVSDVDVIVVGAGSAGAALAARLSENPSRRVLLLEEGPDYRSGATPKGISSIDPFLADGADPTSEHPYGVFGHQQLAARRTSAQAPAPVIRGRGVGGSSAINGLFAVRPTAEDLDGWAAEGAAGWSFEEVLPILMRMEADQDFGGEPYHGDAGPIPIMRPGTSDLRAVDEAFRDAALALGHPWTADHNAPKSTGVSPYAFNALDGRRFSTNDAYLEPARGRANLTVLGDTLVDRILVEGGRAVGVRTLREGAPVEFRAPEVVVSAGAVHSPAILLRSGIGPADDLRRLGIAVQADLPVGLNLQDHPAIQLVLALPEDVTPQPAGSRHARLCLRYGLGLTTEPADAMLSLLSHAALPGYASLCGWSNRVVATGQLTLLSADPLSHPRIDSNLLSDPSDMTRFLTMIDDMIELARHPAMAGAATALTLAGFDLDAGGLSLDQSPSREELRHFVLANVTDAMHISGTCRMGSATDKSSVVDAAGRVLGIDGLRVADASVFPWVPSANTHLSAVLVGEKVADAIEHC